MSTITFKILLLLSFFVGETSLFSSVTITDLKCNYLDNPLGIDDLHPRFSWKLNSDQNGQRQTAYQILVSDNIELLKKNIGNIWDSGKINRSQSIQIIYQGKPLKSRKRYFWKVKVWDANGIPTAYSAIAWWEMGLLHKNDWQGQWISAPPVFDWNQRASFRQSLDKAAPPVHDDPAPIFRKSFYLTQSPIRARAYISGLGYYELYLNGKKVGDHILDPAFTDYSKRVLYVTYDITQQIQRGKNVIGVMLGNGWYNMFTRAVWSFDRAPWRNFPTLLCQVELTFADGTKKVIVSDNTWKCAPGPITFNSIRQGETYNANLEQPEWCTTHFNDSLWYPVRIVDGPKGHLQAQTLPPIKIISELKPKHISKIKNQTYVIDFGQNIAGFIKLKVKGKQNQKITIKYGEQLGANGQIDQNIISVYVREPRFQTDEYIMRGEEIETWHPRFTYHGFRYVEIHGFPEPPDTNNISACVVHTAFDTIGKFSCSNTLLNKIQSNTLWSFTNNFHGYPTDCPQREKLGWLNDAQLASETGLFNFQVQQAYLKWLQDLLDSQNVKGNIPPIVPTSGWGYQWNIGPAYDNAIIIIPYNLYLYTGETRFLKTAYPYMKKYFNYYLSQSNNYLIDLGLGDWCTPKTSTPKTITATAYFFYEAQLLTQIAQILNYKKDAQYFAQLAFNIRKAFHNNFLTPLKIDKMTPTALGCAINLGIVDSLNFDNIANKLCTKLKNNSLNLDFGVIGAKNVLNGLSIANKANIAYNMINTTKYPGWGYWIKVGATTLWETWDGKNSSLNHIMFGDISAWFYKTLGGIRPDPLYPAFKHFYIIPLIPKDLNWLKVEYNSPYGLIRISWKKIDHLLKFLLAIPPNARATMVMPFPIDNLKQTNGIQFVDKTNTQTKLKLESGKYELFFKLPIYSKD